VVGTRLFTPGAVLPETLANAEAHVFSRPDPVLAGNLERHGTTRMVWHDPRPTSPPHVVAQFFANASIPLPNDWEHQASMPTTTTGNALWIHAGSGAAGKNLPLPFLAYRGQLWQEETREPLLVSFGEADLALRDPLRDVFARHGVNYEEVVCPSLTELRTRLAREARLFVGADTGVTHLAAALGKEVLVGFRTTDPAIWRPLGNCRLLSATELAREPRPQRRVPPTKACMPTGQQAHS
jgi:ADP-heptose:LPS heptosyltransferase